MHSTRLAKQKKALEEARAKWAAAKTDAEKVEIAGVFFNEGEGFVDEIASICEAAAANDKRVQVNDEGKQAILTALRGAGYAVDTTTPLVTAAQTVALNTRRGRRKAEKALKEEGGLRAELVSAGVLPPLKTTSTLADMPADEEK